MHIVIVECHLVDVNEVLFSAYEVDDDKSGNIHR
jgi:hypothetical protein